jgi:hypothetical protein
VCADVRKFVIKGFGCNVFVCVLVNGVAEFARISCRRLYDLENSRVQSCYDDVACSEGGSQRATDDTDMAMGMGEST